MLLGDYLRKILPSHGAEAAEKFLKVFQSCHYLHFCLQSVSILSRNGIYQDKWSSSSVKKGSFIRAFYTDEVFCIYRRKTFPSEGFFLYALPSMQ